MVPKFQENPTVNESTIVILLRQVWVYAEKREVLGEEEERMNLGGAKSIETYPKCKTDLVCLYL